MKATGGFVNRPSRVPVPASLRAVWSNVPVNVRPPVTNRLPVLFNDVNALLCRLTLLVLSLIERALSCLATLLRYGVPVPNTSNFQEHLPLLRPLITKITSE